MPLTSRRRIISVLLLAVIGFAVVASRARADVTGAGPDETAASAFGPLSFATTYTGAFTNPNDIDYLAFRVASAGETLGFTVQNTTQACNDPNQAYCPVYATLMDSTGANQVGGSSSDAGTIATYGDTESFTWTFSAPGTYYVLMESDGDLPAGSPAYALTVTTAGSGGTGGGGGTGSGGSGGGTGGSPGNSPSPVFFLRALTVAPHQRGNAVAATVILRGQPALLTVALKTATGHLLAHRTLRRPRAGRHQFRLGLPSGYRRLLARRHRLWVWLALSLRAPSGRTLTLQRRVLLRS